MVIEEYYGIILLIGKIVKEEFWVINWLEEVEKRQEEMIIRLKEFLAIESVLDEKTARDGAPFGEGVNNALEYVLNLTKNKGFTVKNVDGFAGHAEYGEGEELLGILCHVDVVPAGDGWTTPPFQPTIRDGKIFARGSIDDKGPTIAAIFALAIVKELGLKLNKRVRLIFGTNEETEWTDLEHYFLKEEMPNLGFAPDADFPIINAEKGILSITVARELKKGLEERDKGNSLSLKSFRAGLRTNMVPAQSEAEINGSVNDLDEIKKEFFNFLKLHGLTGEAYLIENELKLNLRGISAHAMEPMKGVNAATYLATFLAQYSLQEEANTYLMLIKDYLHTDFFGERLGINFQDELSGRLTANYGIFNFGEDEATINMNIRYPVSTDYEKMVERIKNFYGEHQMYLSDLRNSKPHYVDPDNFLVQTLKKVYEEQTGNVGELLAIGGGTYARALKVGVAFGPLFPGKIETAHQKDEFIELADLFKATAIYAQAIYELAQAK